MKSILLLVSFFFFFLNYSQNEKFPSGHYKSIGKEKEISLKINDDQTYDLIFGTGKIKIENDTIYFNNDFVKKDVFHIKPIFDENETGFSLKFSQKSLSYSYYNIYIGIKNTDNNEIDFKLLEDQINENQDLSDKFLNNEEVNLTIEKGDKLYLMALVDKKYTVFEFEINPKTTSLKIDYQPVSFYLFNLKGFKNENDDLIVSDGKFPLTLSLKSEEIMALNENLLKPINTYVNENFKSHHDSEYEELTEAYANPEPEYQFKLNRFKTLNDAKKNATQFENKFLVVFFDAKSKDINKQFDDFIKKTELQTSYSMYGGYNEDLDLFDFYLASGNDKKALEIKDDKPQMLIFNHEMAKLYFENTALKDINHDGFTSYSSLFDELKKAHEYAKIDKVVYDKKASFKQIKDLLTHISNSYFSHFDAETLTAALINESPIDSEDTEKTEVVNNAVNEVVEEADDYDTYGLKFKENFYKLKSNANDLNQLWIKTFNQIKSKETDKDFLIVSAKELLNDGFSFKLFQTLKLYLNNQELEVLDYLVEKQKDTQKINDVSKQTIENITDDNWNDYSIEYYLESIFNKYASVHDEKTNKIKVFDSFKKFYKNNQTAYSVWLNYINKLIENYNSLPNNSLFNDFDEKFNEITKNKNSLIESLDDYYMQDINLRESYDFNWTAFKSSFAEICNNTSWQVVLYNFDKTWIQKAIYWSETSLKIEAKNHYYLDTLAQLYYKNGQKEKGIQTQESAVEFAKAKEATNLQEYIDVLNKMKDGSY
jgi:predicted transglutaminase-like cysteine proteinase